MHRVSGGIQPYGQRRGRGAYLYVGEIRVAIRAENPSGGVADDCLTGRRKNLFRVPQVPELF